MKHRGMEHKGMKVGGGESSYDKTRCVESKEDKKKQKRGVMLQWFTRMGYLSSHLEELLIWAPSVSSYAESVLLFVYRICSSVHWCAAIIHLAIFSVLSRKARGR